MNSFSWHSMTFTAIFTLMVGGLVTLLFSRSAYTKTKAVPYALAYGIGTVIWLASLFYAQFVANTFLTHQVSFSAGYVLILSMLGLALTFPNSTLGMRTKRLLALDMLVGLVFIGLILFTNVVLTAANFAGTTTAPFSLLGRAYLSILAVNLLAAVAIFVRRYLAEIGNRLYFNYIVLAFILLFLIGGTTNLILPLAGVVTFALVGPLAALLPFAAVIYALGITDINDVTYVIAQLVQVGARVAAAGLLFAAGWLAYRVFNIAYESSLWVIAVSIIVLAGILCFHIFGPLFDAYIENKIAYSRLSPDEARGKLIVGLSGAIELDRNVSLVLKLVKQTIGIRTAGIVLFDKDHAFWTSGDLALPHEDTAESLKTVASLPKRRVNTLALTNVSMLPNAMRSKLEKQGISAIKPLQTESGIRGLYLLGEKFSREIFTRQDATLMDAITEISDLSIERALFYSQIQSFNATLQQRVSNATIRLRKANRRLKTLDRMKDDFISMASHQLRSPATSVHDAIKMLEQGYLTKQERARIIELAEASSERLVSVITDMLSVARIQAGHFTLEKTEVDMGELAERAILQASALAAEKHIGITFDRPHRPIVTQADRAKLNEIMSNYVENAIKYSDEQTTIRIALHEAGGQAHFTVSDQGIGVPESERKDLFGKFYRATNARREHPNGNGIGLFVVKTVAQAHGGDAYYQSLEHGSLFGFWLPLA